MCDPATVARRVHAEEAPTIGVDDTRGVDWIELALQVGRAAVGVSLVAGLRSRR